MAGEAAEEGHGDELVEGDEKEGVEGGEDGDGAGGDGEGGGGEEGVVHERGLGDEDGEELGEGVGEGDGGHILTMLFCSSTCVTVHSSQRLFSAAMLTSSSPTTAALSKNRHI